MLRRLLTLAATFLLVGGIAAPGAVAHDRHRHQRVDIQHTNVFWHAQQATSGRAGDVPGGHALLLRGDRGVAFGLRATELTPRHAYTLWLVVVENPGACSTTPCGAADILTDPATGGQVLYADGLVARRSGRGLFHGSARVGPLEGWVEGRALTAPRSAEIHLVVNDHGPAIPGRVADMTHTYRGGCSDASPFPPVFPSSALNDGIPGPNECRLYQAAVFVAD